MNCFLSVLAQSRRGAEIFNLRAFSASLRLCAKIKTVIHNHLKGLFRLLGSFRLFEGNFFDGLQGTGAR
jgi:hypothetical protein